jgi:hypothetical protein
MVEDINEMNVSKVNSGGLINLRMHNLWVDRHKAAAKGEYNKWNEVLDAIWCELGADVKEDSEEDKKFWLLSMDFADACGEPKKKVGFNKATKSDRQDMAKQKIALIKKELFLRRLQNKQGKGTAYVDEDDFD